MDPLLLLLILGILLLFVALLVFLMLARRLMRGRPKRPSRKRPTPGEPTLQSVLRGTPPSPPEPLPSPPPSPEPLPTAPVMPRPVVVSRDDKPLSPVAASPARADVVPIIPPEPVEEGPIQVLIVDDISETREGLMKLLRFEEGIEVVGTARTGKEGVEAARELKPDIVLMDINMPDMDGIAAAETITREAPQSQLIMMSVQSDADYLRRSMLAGARDFLIKPFGSDDLIATIRRVYELGAKRPRVVPSAPGVVAPTPTPTTPGGLRRAHIIVVYSPQPGAGCTTLATNLAVAIQQAGDLKVGLVDGNYQFGDVGLYLNLQASRSIVDLVSMIEDLDPELVEDIMFPHSSGLRALLAPPRPELADLVTPESLRRILTAMAQTFDVIVIDSWAFLHEVTLVSLELCDRLLLVATQEIPTVKNVKQFLDVLEAMGFPLGKVSLVLNRVDPRAGIDPLDIEGSIRQPLAGQVVADWRLATYAANRGIPFMISHPGSRLAQSIIALVPALLAHAAEPVAAEAAVGGTSA